MGGSVTRPGLILILVLHSVGFTWEQDTRQSDRLLAQRLRQLDTQFRHFQDRTLSHLQNIAENFNVSQSIDTRFQILARQYEGLSRDLRAFKQTTDTDLSVLKAWTQKLQKKTKRLDVKVSQLERALKDGSRLTNRQVQEQREALSGLANELQEHMGHIDSVRTHQEEVRDGIRGLQSLLRQQQTQMMRLEERMRGRPPPLPSSLQAGRRGAPGESPVSSRRHPGSAVQTAERGSRPQARPLKQGRMTNSPSAPPRPTPRGRKVEGGRRMKNMARGSKPTDFLKEPQVGPAKQDSLEEDGEDTEGEDVPMEKILQLPPRHKIPLQLPPRPKASLCNVNAMLVFPSSSTENYVTFTKGFSSTVYELTICSWVKVESTYMGTLFSYATEDNDNKLVLYGRNITSADRVDFVIGDPAHRELPVTALLDRQWHHLCVAWSSIEGRFWHYIDRRLVATGSRFQNGYEIPPGGTLVLGQEQDSLGGDFDPAEAFVGRVAGFSVWPRVLTPGEVSWIATGKGTPRGHVLSLDDTIIRGSVKKVRCECLELCP